MTEKIRKPIGKRKKLPQFTIMNVIEGQAGLENYSSLFFYSLTIDNILNKLDGVIRFVELFFYTFHIWNKEPLQRSFFSVM